MMSPEDFPSKFEQLINQVETWEYRELLWLKKNEKDEYLKIFWPWNWSIHFLAGWFTHESNKKIDSTNAWIKWAFSIKSIEKKDEESYIISINIEPEGEKFPELDYIFEVWIHDTKHFFIKGQKIKFQSPGILWKWIERSSVPIISTENKKINNKKVEPIMMRLLKYSLSLRLWVEKEELSSVWSWGILLTEKDLQINYTWKLAKENWKITSIKVDNPICFKSTQKEKQYNLYYFPQYSDNKYTTFKLWGRLYRVFFDKQIKVEKLYGVNWWFPSELNRWKNNGIVKNFDDREKFKELLFGTYEKIKSWKLYVEYSVSPNWDKKKAVWYFSPDIARKAQEIIDIDL